MITPDWAALALMVVYLGLLFFADGSETIRFPLALVLMGLCLWIGLTTTPLWLLTALLWAANALIDLVRILRS